MDEELLELTRQMRDLIPVLKSLGSTQATSWDRTTDKFVGAIARLTAAMDKNAKTNQQRDKSIDKFTKEVEQYAKAQEEARKKQKETMESLDEVTEAAKKAADELEGTAEGARRARNRALLDNLEREREARYNKDATVTAQRLFEEYGRGVGVAATLREKFENMAGTSVGLYTRNKLVAAGLDGVSKGLMSYGKALVKGEQGMEVTANSIKEFADTVGGAAQAIGAILAFIPQFRVLGIVMSAFGTTTKLAADANKLVAEQSDRLYKAYQELSKVGVTAGDGMIGVAESAVRLGYGLDEVGVQAFTKLMSDASRDLFLLGGSAIEGRRRFADFSGEIVRSDIGRQLMNMGMSVNDINEATAAFVANEARMGRAANLTNQQLIAGSTQYIRELDLLSKLTGQQAKDLQKRMDDDAREERFRATLIRVEREEGKEAAENLRKNIAAVGAVAPDVAAGLKDLAGGFITTDAGAKGFQAGLQGVTDIMKRGVGMGLREVGEAAGNAVDNFSDLGQFGAFNKFLPDLAQMAEIAQLRGLSMADAMALLEKEAKKQREGADGVVGAQTDLRRSQMNSRDALQNLINLGVKPLTASMKSLSETVDDVVRGLGGKPVAGQPMGGGSAGAPSGGGGEGGGVPAGMATTPGAMFSQAFNARKEGEGGIVGAIGRSLRGLGDVVAGPGGRDFYSRGGVANEQAILDFIGKVESRGNYNVLVGGKTKTDPPLTDMTVAQIMEFQRTMRAQGHETDAVGKYQIVSKTMDWLVGSGAISPNDVFNQATQDRAAVALLKRRGWTQYQTGQMSRDAFADSLAKEWAALPMASGQSYYAGQGSNKALVSRGELIDAISAAEGGIARGPKSGYHAILHGTEAVVPLPDGKNIPVALSMPMNMSAPSTDGLTELGQSSPAAIVSAIRSAIADVTSSQSSGGSESTAAMISELQNIANLLARQNTTSERILQVARN